MHSFIKYLLFYELTYTWHTWSKILCLSQSLCEKDNCKLLLHFLWCHVNTFLKSMGIVQKWNRLWLNKARLVVDFSSPIDAKLKENKWKVQMTGQWAQENDVIESIIIHFTAIKTATTNTTNNCLTYNVLRHLHTDIIIYCFSRVWKVLVADGLCKVVFIFNPLVAVVQ